MAEETAAVSSNTGLFILLLLGGSVLLWFANNGGAGGGLFGNTASSTRATSTELSTMVVETTVTTPGGSGSSFVAPEITSRPVSPNEIESDLADAYQRVDVLKQDVETAKIWGTHSAYEDAVTIQSGNMWSTDEDTEYITLYADSHNEAAIDISGWKLESYVTGEDAVVPLGARLPKTGEVNPLSPILLEPGETAYLTTGDSPKGMSFHENLCTGYFTEHQNFTPSVPRACPYPLEEMRKFGNIDLNDDECYNFVTSLSSCTTPTHEAIRNADLSSVCESFVDNDLTYAGCVINHQDDPYFPYFLRGAWHIFLGSERELWRGEREIVKLLDQNGHTVAVLRY